MALDLFMGAPEPMAPPSTPAHAPLNPGPFSQREKGEACSSSWLNCCHSRHCFRHSQLDWESIVWRVWSAQTSWIPAFAGMTNKGCEDDVKGAGGGDGKGPFIVCWEVHPSPGCLGVTPSIFPPRPCRSGFMCHILPESSNNHWKDTISKILKST